MSKEISIKQWLSVKEVSEYLGLKPTTVYGYVAERRIPYHKIPGSHILKFKLSEVDEWLETCRVETKEEYIRRIKKKENGNGNAKAE